MQKRDFVEYLHCSKIGINTQKGLTFTGSISVLGEDYLELQDKFYWKTKTPVKIAYSDVASIYPIVDASIMNRRDRQ